MIGYFNQDFLGENQIISNIGQINFRMSYNIISVAEFLVKSPCFFLNVIDKPI